MTCILVQELCDKAPQMPDDVRWHFIGHLQSNKTKALVGALVPALLRVPSSKLKVLTCKRLLQRACQT